MDQEKLFVAGIDYENGLKRFCGKTALYEKFLLKFPEDENYALLKDSLQNNDYDAAFRYAHTLKGIAGNLSLKELYEKIAPLVEALRNGRVEEIGPYLSGVVESYQKILSAIL